MHHQLLRSVSALLLAISHCAAAFSQTSDADAVVVSAAKLPAELSSLPSMMTVISGAQLRDRGARDLRTALSLAAGIDIAPGGDAGPAGAIPGMWGLREFDAFLLVVDGIPYGGAFNPALVTLDLTNVERIEVLRGAAPVTFGATSFVGVIHVIHSAAGHTPASVALAGGNRSTWQAALQGDLPGTQTFQQSASVSTEHRAFSQRDSSIARAHLLYRAALETAAGRWRADVDATQLKQDPYSPHPREGNGLSTRFPLDANVNPRDGRQDQDRLQFNLGFEQSRDDGRFAASFSAARTTAKAVRGFLRDGFDTDGVTPNADGFRQTQNITDVWTDLNWTQRSGANLRWAVGVDWLFGNGQQHSDNFEFAVLPDGSNRPLSTNLHVDEFTRLEVRRNFAGAYAEADWDVTTRWKILAGARLNRTVETRDGAVQSTDGETPIERGNDRRVATRPSATIGTSYSLLGNGLQPDAGQHSVVADSLSVFADWRSAYKPAAADLGPEAETHILRPETSHSYEVGLRGRTLAGRLSWEASAFDMDFRNLVIRENVGGLPSLANAGRERLRGAEIEASLAVTTALRLTATTAWHDSKFVDYGRLRPDGTVQQLAGKTLELSPRQLASLGVVFAPAGGFTGSLVCSYSGRRFLNKSNTVTAGGFTLLDAGLGYRARRFELRIDGTNLTDRRDPVAESELGDPQFYRLPGRTLLASVNMAL